MQDGERTPFLGTITVQSVIVRRTEVFGPIEAVSNNLEALARLFRHIGEVVEHLIFGLGGGLL